MAHDIRRKYKPLFNVDALFDDGSRMNICRDLLVYNKNDIMALISKNNLKDVVCGAPTFIKPFNVIVSIFPTQSIKDFRKELLQTFPHFNQEVPWIPRIDVKNTESEEVKMETLNELKKKVHTYFIKSISVYETS